VIRPKDVAAANGEGSEEPTRPIRFAGEGGSGSGGASTQDSPNEARDMESGWVGVDGRDTGVSMGMDGATDEIPILRERSSTRGRVVDGGVRHKDD
jgi:hypothetical protein